MIKKFIIYSFQNKQGFTLIESMVAITIITLATVGPMFTASRSIIAARIASDKLTASYLAQEGIEYVRAVRDDKFLDAFTIGGTSSGGDTSGAWNVFTSSILICRTTTQGNAPFCTYDPDPTIVASNRLVQCPVLGGCAPLRLPALLSDTQIYTQNSSGTQTKFTRTIQTMSIDNKDEKIVSTVSWNFHGVPYSVIITTHLTSWQ